MTTELPPEEHPWPDDNDEAAAVEPAAVEPAPPIEPPAASVDPPPAPDTAGPPPAPAPGGVYAASVSTDGSGILAPTAPAARNRGRWAVIGALGVAAAIFIGKVAIGLLTATAVSGVLGGVFGGPFQKVPTDQREQMEKRFDAAVGDSLKGLSDTDIDAKVQAMLTDGLPRLEDAPLVERMQLVVKMADAADEGDVRPRGAGVEHGHAGSRRCAQGAGQARQRIDRPLVRHQPVGHRGDGSRRTRPQEGGPGRGRADPR